MIYFISFIWAYLNLNRFVEILFVKDLFLSCVMGYLKFTKQFQMMRGGEDTELAAPYCMLSL